MSDIDATDGAEDLYDDAEPTDAESRQVRRANPISRTMRMAPIMNRGSARTSYEMPAPSATFRRIVSDISTSRANTTAGSQNFAGSPPIARHMLQRWGGSDVGAPDRHTVATS
jgi:hypothetical protein